MKTAKHSRREPTLPMTAEPVRVRCWLDLQPHTLYLRARMPPASLSTRLGCCGHRDHVFGSWPLRSSTRVPCSFRGASFRHLHAQPDVHRAWLQRQRL